VEFSFHENQTKTGNQKYSDSTWAQRYQLDLAHFIWDPRFLVFSAGTNYNIYTSEMGSDSRALGYNFHTSFFPGMKINWDAHADKTIHTVQGTATLAGNDVTTTSYGATLNLRLGSGGSRGGNNNDNNNNNNRYGRSIALPDLSFSKNHMETESQSGLMPLHETRDDSTGTLHYRFNSAADLNLDGAIQNYKNLIGNASYDTRTLNVISDIRLLNSANLTLTGRLGRRDTENFTGYSATQRITGYGALLRFRENEGLHHYYQYDHVRTDATGLLDVADTVQARVIYKITPNLEVNGGLNYSQAEHTVTAAAEQKSTLNSGSLLGGVSYRDNDALFKLEHFSFMTSYNFTLGFSDLSSETGGPAGSGYYYTNNAGLSFSSKGWQYESLAAGYTFMNKRDDSPMNNDMNQQNMNFNLATTRISNTRLSATSNYSSQIIKADAGAEFLNQLNINQKNRQFVYDINATYAVTSYLAFQAGAGRSEQTSSTYTIAALGPAPGTTLVLSNLLYAQADFNYAFTRNLKYRANLRDEVRKAQHGGDLQTYQLNMDVDYRVRSIFVNLQYRWREESPEGSLKTQQQYMFAKVTRPF
jgi:hypothetical protein